MRPSTCSSPWKRATLSPLSLGLLLLSAAVAVSSFGSQTHPSSRYYRSSSSTSSFARHVLPNNRYPDTRTNQPRRCFLHPRGGGRSGSSRLPSTASSSSAASADVSSASASAVSEENLAVLSDRGRSAIERLVEYDTNAEGGGGAQRHVYGDWPPPGTDDEGKRRLADQVRNS